MRAYCSALLKTVLHLLNKLYIVIEVQKAAILTA